MANTKQAPKARKTTQASPLPTAATAAPAAPAAPVTVALRGGIAVQAVVLSGKPYRVAAAHNQQWWQTTAAAVAAAGPKGASVAALLLTPSNPGGVPGHFLGYVIRRGYLQAAPV